jgi:hypothetical protein
LKEKERLGEEKKKKEEEAAEKLVKLNQKVKTVGNYVAPGVVVSKDEADNNVLRTWAPEGVKVEGKEKEGWIPHHGVLTRLNGFDSGTWVMDCFGCLWLMMCREGCEDCRTPWVRTLQSWDELFGFANCGWMIGTA